MHLTTEEHGAYLLLIMNYWQRGKPLNNSNERLASVVRMSNECWLSVKDTLAEFFDIEGDLWRHRRIDGDLEYVAKKQEAKAKAGKASAAARKKAKQGGDLEQTLNKRSPDVPTKSNEQEQEQEQEKNGELRSRAQIFGLWDEIERLAGNPKRAKQRCTDSIAIRVVAERGGWSGLGQLNRTDLPKKKFEFEKLYQRMQGEE